MSFIETPKGNDLFEKFLQRFDGRASQKVYRSEVRQFFDWYRGEPETLTDDDFKKYGEHISAGSTPGTVKRKFSMLNGFFGFLEQNGFSCVLGKAHGHLSSFQPSTFADSDQFDDLLKRWSDTLVTASTKKTYTSHVRLFFKHIGKTCRGLKHDDFIRYRDHLRSERQMQNSTIWVRFVALNRFFAFLGAQDPKAKHPFTFKELRLIPPKMDKGYYDILTEEEVIRLLDAPDRRTPIGKRDYLILRLMLVYGLRCNEVCKIQWKDADHERYKGKLRIWIRDRKGRIGKRQDTPIILEGKELDAWDAWIESSKIQFEPDDRVMAPFVYNLGVRGLEIDRRKMDTGKPRVNKTIWNLLQKHMDESGIERGDRRISPHALRHTAFTFLARNGVSLIDLKKLAAHQDAATTLIYMHSVQSFDDHVGMKNPLAKL